MTQGLRLPPKVAEQAHGMVENGIRLARLGASHSARAEFTQALRLTAQALDAQIGRQVHSRALSRGLIALDEAEDFAHPMSRPEHDLMLTGLVAGHKTEILKKFDLSATPPLVALQKYYEYAYRQLSIGGGEEAPASKALFALAKLDDFRATQRDVTYLHKAPRLIALYQAALTIFPQNSQAANELGVQLAATGQMRAAGEALRHGLRRAPTVTLWRNLAEVHRRLGEHTLARKAENESRLATQFAATPTTVTPRDLVQWVTPVEFARSAGPQHMTPVARSSSPSERTGTFVK
jgi:tetratricopeptide (TPR) repeat protein